MAFNVGEGVLQKMQELGDAPIADSVFVNLLGATIEIGQGTKANYLAHDFGGDWEFAVQRKDALPPVVDLRARGKLPWRGNPPANPYPLRALLGVTQVCVHYTAAPPERTVQDIAKYQTTVQTGDLFPAIAYHLFVEMSGMVIWCHDFNRRTWGSGAPGVNERAVHVCYSGNVAPNPAQLKGIAEAIEFTRRTLSRPLEVRGHKDDYATQCPGNTWPQWKDDIE